MEARPCVPAGTASGLPDVLGLPVAVGPGRFSGRVQLSEAGRGEGAECREVYLHPAASDLPDEVSVSGDNAREDDPLLPLVARGDDGAMERCIARHGPVVWGVITRRVSDRSAAEDLAQEIFTEVWRKAGKHDPKLASEGGYIAMIARRRTIDWLRHKQRLPELTQLPESHEIAAESPEPGVALDGESLRAALGQLPEETRRLFMLHFDQGMSHTEIADSTGLPLGSVKTRLRRGLIEARALLKRLSVGMNAEGGVR
jgi:RNA polymerase sigma-70 factor, ECF subfamily